MTDTVNGGTNRSALIEQVRKSFKQYADLEDKRAEINAGMNEIRARWKSQGLSVKGIKAGLSRAKLDAEMRDLFDESYDLAADAHSLPIHYEPDFFEDEDLFKPEPGADDLDEGDSEDTTHLSEEEKAAAQHGDGSEADLGKGLDHDDDAEQAAGEAAFQELAPETLGKAH